MKKFYFLLMLVVALAFTSCESCSNNEGTDDAASIEWNLNVAAKGEGVLGVTYPTGRLDLNGTAEMTATTASDTALMVALANAPTYDMILANPAEYTEEQVYLANQVQSAFNVDTMSGKWNLDITGYAKYSNIYIVIDEHFPREEAADSVAVPVVDTVAVK